MGTGDIDDPGFEQRVRADIARLLLVPVDRVTPTATLDVDLGVDSLLHMTMVMGLEGEFGVELPDRDAARLRTVTDVIDVLRAHLAGRATDAPGTSR